MAETIPEPTELLEALDGLAAELEAATRPVTLSTLLDDLERLWFVEPTMIADNDDPMPEARRA